MVPGRRYDFSFNSSHVSQISLGRQYERRRRRCARQWHRAITAEEEGTVVHDLLPSLLTQLLSLKVRRGRREELREREVSILSLHKYLTNTVHSIQSGVTVPAVPHPSQMPPRLHLALAVLLTVIVVGRRSRTSFSPRKALFGSTPRIRASSRCFGLE